MKIEKQASVLTAGAPNAEQLEKINAQTKSPLRAEEVYVFSVRLCDDQVDRDFERFSQQALEQLAPMFIGKTGISDHAWSAERQLARIFDAGVVYESGTANVARLARVSRIRTANKTPLRQDGCFGGDFLCEIFDCAG